MPFPTDSTCIITGVYMTRDTCFRKLDMKKGERFPICPGCNLPVIWLLMYVHRPFFWEEMSQKK
jgi:hypothetical protein